MNFLSLLNAVTDITLLEQGYGIGLDWLGQFARVIIEGVGVVGLGIIVFNLVLKAITLPFDIYQRVSSRKQNLIMRQMQPELEKLQKQYAGDKATYNQKMFELQKKNGYSMLGACLPMLVSFIILIVAWQGFRAYSQYANLSYFVKMSESYNAAILEHGEIGNDFSMRETDVKTEFYRTVGEEEQVIPMEWTDGGVLLEENGTVYTLTDDKTGDTDRKYLTVKSTDGTKYIYYKYNLETSSITREYQLDLDRFGAVLGGMQAEEGDTVTQNAIDTMNAYLQEPTDEHLSAYAGAAKTYVVRIGATAAAERFRSDDPSFLWIKNVWYPDVSYSHPIPDYNTFKNQLNVKVTLANGEEKTLTQVIGEPVYNDLTSELTAEKSAPNGYFILIILAIGFMLLSQIVAMKSNKEANKYQTVDGQGATSQKVMLVVMPLIYALFSFTYSAAFSIYMTMSSVVAIIVTLLTNLILGKVFKKREEAQQLEIRERKPAWMKDDAEKERGKKGKSRK